MLTAILLKDAKVIVYKLYMYILLALGFVYFLWVNKGVVLGTYRYYTVT